MTVRGPQPAQPDSEELGGIPRRQALAPGAGGTGRSLLLTVPIEALPDAKTHESEPDQEHPNSGQTARIRVNAHERVSTADSQHLTRAPARAGNPPVRVLETEHRQPQTPTFTGLDPHKQ